MTRLEPLSVLFLTDLLGVGGAESQLVALVNALDPERIRARVVVLRDDAPLAGMLRAPCEILGMRGPLDIRVLPRLRAMIARERVLAIHTTHVRAALIARALRQTTSLPASRRRLLVLTTEHSHRRPPATPILDWIRRRTAGLSDRIIAVSEAQAGWLRKTLAIPGDRIVVIPNAIDPDFWADLPPQEPVRRELRIGPDEPVFLCTARLAPVKDHGTLLSAMARVEGHLILVGDGPERARIEAAARGNNLTGRVHVVGERRDPRPYLAAAWAVCLSSIDESHGVALLEGMAGGRPAVATRVGGVPEIVEEGVTGLLVPPRDPEALAVALSRVARDAEWRRAAGEAARRAAVKAGSIQTRARRIESMIEAIVGQATR